MARVADGHLDYAKAVAEAKQLLSKGWGTLSHIDKGHLVALHAKLEQGEENKFENFIAGYDPLFAQTLDQLGTGDKDVPPGEGRNRYRAARDVVRYYMRPDRAGQAVGTLGDLEKGHIMNLFGRLNDENQGKLVRQLRHENPGFALQLQFLGHFT
jgi:hypothetical protein